MVEDEHAEAAAVAKSITPGSADVHVVHERPRGISISLTRNSKGYTWEVSHTAETLDEALAIVREGNSRLLAEYGKAE